MLRAATCAKYLASSVANTSQRSEILRQTVRQLLVLRKLGQVRLRVSHGRLYVYTHAHTHIYMNPPFFENKSLSHQCDKSLYYSVYKDIGNVCICIYVCVHIYIYIYIHVYTR